ncbi:MAG: hypothetical protein EXR93_06835 [Gemmatimonadetes bacterium]|nr:hypothetical protein [Gemmatimonadota bacterium]
MRLLHLADVPVTARDHVFAYSRTRAIVFTGSIVAGCGALVWFGWREQFWLPPVIAGMFLLGLLLFRETITARFQPTNWLVRADNEGLLVKFRSYLNRHFPDDTPSVISIPYAFLAPHVRILPATRTRVDYTKLDEKGQREQETRLIELVQTGETMAAIKMARKIYAFDLTEAKQFVDGLRGNKRA